MRMAKHDPDPIPASETEAAGESQLSAPKRTSGRPERPRIVSFVVPSAKHAELVTAARERGQTLSAYLRDLVT